MQDEKDKKKNDEISFGVIDFSRLYSSFWAEDKMLFIKLNVRSFTIIT